ncbi:hypothetical protein [Streptomyces sp. bgisy091]
MVESTETTQFIGTTQFLAPTAAAGLLMLMAGAAVIHGRRKEFLHGQNI